METKTILTCLTTELRYFIKQRQTFPGTIMLVDQSTFPMVDQLPSIMVTREGSTLLVKRPCDPCR
jgi:hypothetical protein